MSETTVEQLARIRSSRTVRNFDVIWLCDKLQSLLDEREEAKRAMACIQKGCDEAVAIAVAIIDAHSYAPDHIVDPNKKVTDG